MEKTVAAVLHRYTKMGEMRNKIKEIVSMVLSVTVFLRSKEDSMKSVLDSLKLVGSV